MFYRNKQALFFTFFSPLLIMVIFGVIGLDKVNKIDVGLSVHGAPTAGTTQFVNSLKNSPLFNVTEGSEADERSQITNDKVSAVFIIPGDLIADQGMLGQSHTVTVLTNAGQVQQSQTAASVMNGILNNTALQIAGAEDLFKLNVEEINTHHLKYVDFLLPGLIAMSLMQMSIFSVAFVFTNYKEKGILKRLVATPMRPATFVGANVITRLIVSFFQTAVFVLVGVLFLHAHVVGSYWLVALITILGSVIFMGLACTISGLYKTSESVPAFANLIAFPMLFLGGTFFDINAFPSWLQHIAKYLPLTYLSDSMRQVMTKAAGFGAIAHDIYWMVGWCVALLLLATYTFSFEEKRN
jgi:ABC-2 type transport system permease protein